MPSFRSFKSVITRYKHAYRLTPLAMFHKMYSQQLDNHPLITKGATAAFISGLGDLACQGLFEGEGLRKKKFKYRDWDQARTLRFVALGALLEAPFLHFYYDHFLAKHIPGRTPVQVAKRVAVDQFVVTPMITLAWLGGLWSMEGLPRDEFPGRIKARYPEIMIANWALWIPANSFIFYAIPRKYWVLSNNLVDLVWNTALSYLAVGRWTEPKTKESSSDTNSSDIPCVELQHIYNA